MLPTTTKSLIAGSLIAAFAAVVPQAQAATIIELSDGIAPPVLVVDGGAGDLSAAAGVVVFSGSVGVFDVNVTTGLSFPLLGSSTAPVLELNSVNVSSSGVGTLTIKFTTTGYTGPLPTGTANLFAGGTTNGSASISSYIDLTDAPFGTGILTGIVSSPAPGDFSGNDSSVGLLSSPYSASIIATVVHNDPGDVTSFGAEYSIVPEPGSIALIAIGAGMLGYRRRRSA